MLKHAIAVLLMTIAASIALRLFIANAPATAEKVGLVNG